MATRFALRGDGASRRPKPALCAATRWRLPPRHVRRPCAASFGVTTALRAALAFARRATTALRAADRPRSGPRRVGASRRPYARAASRWRFVPRPRAASIGVTMALRAALAFARCDDGASRRRRAAFRVTTRRRCAPPHVCASRGVKMALHAAPRPCSARRRVPARLVRRHDGVTTALRAALAFARRDDGASRRR